VKSKLDEKKEEIGMAYFPLPLSCFQGFHWLKVPADTVARWKSINKAHFCISESFCCRNGSY
jgi:hypothetical protein